MIVSSLRMVATTEGALFADVAQPTSLVTLVKIRSQAGVRRALLTAPEPLHIVGVHQDCLGRAQTNPGNAHQQGAAGLLGQVTIQIPVSYTHLTLPTTPYV
jgi:hypothetical protein